MIVIYLLLRNLSEKTLNKHFFVRLSVLFLLWYSLEGSGKSISGYGCISLFSFKPFWVANVVISWVVLFIPVGVDVSGTNSCSLSSSSTLSVTEFLPSISSSNTSKVHLWYVLAQFPKLFFVHAEKLLMQL